MDRKLLTKFMDGINKDRMKLMRGKSQDYASNEDALANFKRMSMACSLFGVEPARSPGDCAAFLLLLKFDRYMNLKNSGAAPANECIRDTVIDGHNYFDLMFINDLDTGK